MRIHKNQDGPISATAKLSHTLRLNPCLPVLKNLLPKSFPYGGPYRQCWVRRGSGGWSSCQEGAFAKQAHGLC